GSGRANSRNSDGPPFAHDAVASRGKRGHLALRAGSRPGDRCLQKLRTGDTMAGMTNRPPNSRAVTADSPEPWARRTIAALALLFLFTLAPSEARAGIAFVK